MAVHSPSRSFTRPSPQVAQSARVQAPFKGMDTRTQLSRGDPEHAIWCINIGPSDQGMRVRSGYREWAVGLENTSGAQIGTIIPFGGDDDNQADDRLFAVTNEGIWDITTEAATPTLVLDFSEPGNGEDTSPFAGYGVYTAYVSEADEQYLFYADSRNGLFEYISATDTWQRKSDVVGPNAQDVVFVVSHQRQLWFVEKNSSSAWYLNQNSIGGTATEFFFGAKFKHGGNLAGLFSWTVDGGEGVNDYLVAVSRAGDVMPYLGTDPSSADHWESKGNYFIGKVPKGNRIATQEGGDIQMLCAFGIISIDDLLSGVDGKNVQELTQTLKIASLIRQDMAALIDMDGWDIKFLPSQGSYLINTPERTSMGGAPYRQYVQNITTSGWGLWRDVPISAFDEWRGKVYFGTADLRVMVMDVPLDDVLLDPPDPLSNGDPIDFSVLTNFLDMGAPTQFKRAKYVRTQYVTQSRPSASTKILYDYDSEEILNTSTSQVTNSHVWDVGVWDDALWAASLPQGADSLVGAWGIGRNLAIATRGRSNSETILIGWDVLWDAGSPV